MIHILLTGSKDNEQPKRALTASQAATILLQSGGAMGFIRESWSESQVLALPDGEHNFFDRKSGELWADKGKLYTTIAKALSAFANSSGGHLILGQQDNGSINGIPEQEGRTPIREWLEQKIPTLVSYPLEAFRVHLVTPDEPSQIPDGKALVVIDIGESRLAPHQSAFPSDAPQYYYRQGGKSILAPHHYLEALRNRLTFAVVEPSLNAIKVVNSHNDEDGYVVEILLIFRVKNVSQIACYKWTVSLSIKYQWDEEEEKIDLEKLLMDSSMYPRLGSGRIEMPMDKTILPTQTFNHQCLLGLRINPDRSIREQVERFLSWEAVYSAISETYLGPERQTKLSEVAELEDLTTEVTQSLNAH